MQVPRPNKPHCTNKRRCITMNCPWKKYPDRGYQKYRHTDCIPIHKLKRSRFDAGFNISQSLILIAAG